MIFEIDLEPTKKCPDVLRRHGAREGCAGRRRRGRRRRPGAPPSRSQPRHAARRVRRTATYLRKTSRALGLGPEKHDSCTGSGCKASAWLSPALSP